MISPQLTRAMFQGVCGDFALAICGDKFLGGGSPPKSESAPAAILFQTLTALGAVLGRTVSIKIDGGQHYPAIFTLVVGKSAKARKGTSLNHVKNLFKRVDPEWFGSSVVTGMSSGEGLINRLSSSDGNDRREESRLLVTETEFARVFHMNKREGNTLSTVIREGWDSSPMQVMTKKDPLCADGYHFGIVGHITLHELKQSCSEVEITNGFLNRFLIVYSDRSVLIPNPVQINEELYDHFARSLKIVIEKAASVDSVRLNQEAQIYWETLYETLYEIEETDPKLNSILGREEPYILRLAMLYCLSDGKSEVTQKHLESAYSAWIYCRESARLIFTDFGSRFQRVAQLISTHKELTKGDLHKALGNNFPAAELTQILSILETRKQIIIEKEASNGRPREVIKLLRGEQDPLQPLPN